MNRATPKLRNFAEHLIAHEAKLNSPGVMNDPEAFPVLERLRPHLATFTGNAGFRALLLRAHALACAEVPRLRAFQMSAVGSLEASSEMAKKAAAEEIYEGRVVLLAQLLGLVVAFIGEKLTLQLVRDVWPKVSLKDLNARKGDPS